ncbi:MAG: helix-turn-helix domain-containing protein [Blastocatellia bacterium]
MTGEEIRRRREKLGLTQAQLGELFGVTWNTISRLENGHTTVEHEGMMRLAFEALEMRKAVLSPELKKLQAEAMAGIEALKTKTKRPRR